MQNEKSALFLLLRDSYGRYYNITFKRTTDTYKPMSPYVVFTYIIRMTACYRGGCI